ncbi:hypothetical protein RhiirA1_441459 [Rhizophagus irregularis]|uniref:Uncharacterized protein n=1 Tax=Rhizophagus irregularis TaxID=588596 RepID=A0A2N0RUF6_9GLOM|nr:hypothetical protein RhiirA1_441459 [Rhizophagus irregularis]
MAYFTKNLGVSTIIHLTVLMECPATSPDGVVTVFSIQGWKNHMNAFNDRWYSEVSFFGNIITPERPPDNIKDNWQMMIKEAIEKDDVVTSGSIIQGDLDMGQMKGLGLALHSLDTTREWEVHITNIFFKVIRLKKKMISLLKAESKAELNQIFSDIEKSDGNDVKDWIDYYQRTHILATMNSLASLMDVEIWNRLFSCPYTKQDKSQVKRQLLAINRKEKRNQKNKEDNNSLKRKYGQSKIQPIDENNYEFESDNSRSFRA